MWKERVERPKVNGRVFWGGMKISRPFSFVKLGRFCSNRSWNVKGLRIFCCLWLFIQLCVKDAH